MVREKKLPKSTPVRITDDAIRWARIASGYTGESMAEYVSRIVTEKAKADVEEQGRWVMEELASQTKG